MELTAAEVIERLKELQVERVRIIQEERRLLTLLERASDPQESPGQGLPSEDDLSVLSALSEFSYDVGAKVYIKNKLGALAPEGRKAKLKDRAATIVAVEDNRIYIRNYNGKESWRAAHNLRALTRQEFTRLSTQTRR